MKNHVHFSEMFALLDYRLVGNENTAVELTHKVANEFVAALYLL